VAGPAAAARAEDGWRDTAASPADAATAAAKITRDRGRRTIREAKREEHAIEATLTAGGEKLSGLGRFGGTWSIDEFTTHHWVSAQHAHRAYPLPGPGGAA
jgi:hypothetical protein